MVSCQKELWSEYCRLHKEVKEISIWNEVIGRANNFEGSRKEFGAFVSRRSKGKRNIASLKNEVGISSH